MTCYSKKDQSATVDTGKLNEAQHSRNLLKQISQQAKQEEERKTVSREYTF